MFQIFFYEKDQTSHFENILKLEPSPFVVVNSKVSESTYCGQGVLISENGLLLTVGHLAWSDKKMLLGGFCCLLQRRKKNLWGKNNS